MARESFSPAIAYVLAHEAGYVNDPRDNGGPTNLGITLATLSAWRGVRVTAADVQALGRPEATAIYRSEFWDRIRADLLPRGLDYGLTEKRFVLFNALRWGPLKEAFDEGLTDAFPNCVDLVPVLYSGAFTPECVDDCMRRLATEGSVLVPGFRKPEGIIALMLGTPLKHTFEHTNGKWATELATQLQAA